MTPKVSVVVAAYNTGDRVGALVASLDEQSLPPGEFEVVVVDDGSTDGTRERFEQVAARRPSYTVTGIENSGWPGRPRNVGTDLARGEYVLYMDHDDTLFPTALERMYEYGRANRADVVVGREVRVGGGAVGWDLFRENVPRVPVVDDVLLSVLTPHKLYRRQFLLDRAIRFPEGRRRLEDHHFNLQAYLTADTIAVLADVPCYAWINHRDGSNNSARRADPGQYWGNVEEVLDIVERLVPPGPVRDRILLKWYRGRVVWFAGPGKLGRWDTSYGDQQFAVMHSLVNRRFPVEMDALLTPIHRARVRLVRDGDAGGSRRLHDLDAGVTCQPSLDGLSWVGGCVALTARATVVRRDGTPFPVRVTGSGVELAVPEHLADLMRAEDRDITDHIGRGTVEFSLRERDSCVEWIVPGTGTVEVVSVDGVLSLQASCTATIDVASAAGGGGLGSGVWDVYLRVSVLGFDLRRRVAAAGLAVQPALVAGRAVIPYRTREDNLSIDVDQHLRTLVGSARPQASHVTVTDAADGCLLVLSLPGVHVQGDAQVPARVAVGDVEFAAELTVTGGSAAVRARIGALAGRHRLGVAVAGRHKDLGLELVVDSSGGGTVERPGRPAASQAGTRSIGRGAARGLRRQAARTVARFLGRHRGRADVWSRR